MKRKYYKSQQVTANTTNVIITFTPESTLQDLQDFNFIICQKIPTSGETLPVLFSIAGTTYPLLDKYGNAAIGANISARRAYIGYFTTQGTAHFISPFVPDELCNCTCFNNSNN